MYIYIYYHFNAGGTLRLGGGGDVEANLILNAWHRVLKQVKLQRTLSSLRFICVRSPHSGGVSPVGPHAEQACVLAANVHHAIAGTRLL